MSSAQPGESMTVERADAQGFTVGAGLSLSGDTGYLSGNPGPQSDLRKCPARVTVAMFL